MRILKVLKHEINLPIIVILIGILIGIYHIFSYLIPFTDNAFIVTNITPIAADVSGYITEINIKNGEKVTKGQKLFVVYQEPYRLAYEQAKARYEEAIEHIDVIKKQIHKLHTQLNSAKYDLEKTNYEYNLKKSTSVANAVSKLEVKKLFYDKQSLTNQMLSLDKEIQVESQLIKQQQKQVNALKAEMDNAKINLDLTTVVAPDDGIIDNMYLSVGTPVKIHEPLFSFIDTNNWWVQANFNETDLRYVRPGDKVTIILRMYYFDKIFHGEIVNTIWAADRQTTSSRTQQQKIVNENQWLMLPQRFPLQIKVLDYDPKYPLNPGASAYVYIHTRN